MREITCCFTGHRQLPPVEQAEIANRLESIIATLYKRGIRYYGAGGALGFDTLAAQTVLRLRENCPGMKLILVLPCLTQTRGWRPEAVAEYVTIDGGVLNIYAQNAAIRGFYNGDSLTVKPTARPPARPQTAR